MQRKRRRDNKDAESRRDVIEDGDASDDPVEDDEDEVVSGI